MAFYPSAIVRGASYVAGKEIFGGRKRKRVDPNTVVSQLRTEARHRIKGAGLSQQTTQEAFELINRTELGNFGNVQGFLGQLLSGEDTPLRRRENLRLRTEVARDRPGTRGLLLG